MKLISQVLAVAAVATLVVPAFAQTSTMSTPMHKPMMHSTMKPMKSGKKMAMHNRKMIMNNRRMIKSNKKMMHKKMMMHSGSMMHKPMMHSTMKPMAKKTTM